MLYNTHKKYGQLFGLGALGIAGSVGTFDELGVIGTLGAVVVAMTASKFGAEFPDIDSKQSKPAQKHKILRSIFEAFGVKHRGRFSHDVVVQTLFWSLILFIANMLMNMVVVPELVSFYVGLYIVFSWVGVMSHLFADALTVEGIYFGLVIKVTLMPVFIKKFGFGKWRPLKKAFTAGSSWNDMHFKLLSVVNPLVLVLVLINMI